MLLAFHSKGQRAGKDTAGQFVGEWCAERGIWFERRAFADKMKMLAALTLGHGAAQERDWPAAIAVMDDLKLHGHVGWALTHTQIDWDMTGRDFIINLAEGARQLFGEHFWIDQTLPGVDTYAQEEHRRGCIAVTDLRFDVEADHVHRLGGVVVEIANPRAIDPGGRSEQGLDPRMVDCQVDNSGTLEEFRSQIRWVAANYCPSLLWSVHNTNQSTRGET